MRERQRLAIHAAFREVFKSRARDRDGAPTLRRTSRERGDRIRRLGDANERVMFSRARTARDGGSLRSHGRRRRRRRRRRHRPHRHRAPSSKLVVIRLVRPRARSNVRARECGAEREISTRVAFASSRRRRVSRACRRRSSASSRDVASPTSSTHPRDTASSRDRWNAYTSKKHVEWCRFHPSVTRVR